jgi:F-type H+-transporting ATPase subunit b
MILLNSTGALLSVSVGTVFWASVSFLIVLYLLTRFAWKPILKSLKDRELSIENSLNEAENARQQMASLKAGNEQLLKEAREERDRIIREAKEIGEKTKADIVAKAQAEADRKIQSAIQEIDNQKKAAITEMKNLVASISVEIAEKLVREKLTDSEKQRVLNDQLINQIGKN